MSWPHPTRIYRYETIKPKRPVWRDGCLWRKHGLWDLNRKTGKATVLRAGYFHVHPRNGRKVEFYREYWFPFVKAFGEEIANQDNEKRRNWFIFAAAVPNEVEIFL